MKKSCTIQGCARSAGLEKQLFFVIFAAFLFVFNHVSSCFTKNHKSSDFSFLCGPALVPSTALHVIDATQLTFDAEPIIRLFHQYSSFDEMLQDHREIGRTSKRKTFPRRFHTLRITDLLGSQICTEQGVGPTFSRSVAHNISFWTTVLSVLGTCSRAFESTDSKSQWSENM